MKANFGQQEAVQNAAPGRGKVTVSMHPVRERVFLDRDGNELSSLNPRNRQIIKRVDESKP